MENPEARSNRVDWSIGKDKSMNNIERRKRLRLYAYTYRLDDRIYENILP